MTLSQVWLMVLISNAIGGIVLSVLYLFLKDKFDREYVKRKEVPQKNCYDVFITKEMHKEKELRMEDILNNLNKSIIDLKKDVGEKFDLLLDLLKGK